MPQVGTEIKASTTGRYLVLLHKDRIKLGTKRLAELGRLKVIHSGQRPGRPLVPPAERSAVVFDGIGVALVNCSPEIQALISQAAGDDAILAVEPEREVRALARNPGGIGIQSYLQGYRDAVEDLARRLPQILPGRLESAEPYQAAVTWGVEAVGADQTSYDGAGIRIAVLDTGLDMQHPDFAGREITAHSFVEGQSEQDGNGHGTHCAGIAAGPPQPESQARYGVAGSAELYIGKVLDDTGRGSDGNILQGINWAIENRCTVISMSLGSPMEPGQSYSAVFEEVAKRALAAGTLIVAAAGNESERPERVAPVGHPANCPSIMAVGAVDQGLQVAPFSNGGLEAQGGEVDIAAPGVDVLSSWPMPKRYNSISGTSMATPFVAGVAALYAQADTSARGSTLWDQLEKHAKALSEPKRDVGTGLVQVPEQR